MSGKKVTIKLVSPLIGHDGPMTELELREPNFRDLIELGDPQEYIRTADGHVVPSTNWGIVGDYVERCVRRKSPSSSAPCAFRTA
jgi:hypothetical protein